VQQLLLNQRAQGCAILLVSEDLDELLSLSDRIAVMYEGHVVGTICSGDFDINQIGLMMTGTIPQDLKSPSSVEDSSGSNENSSISAPSSRFDEVLDHVKSFEESSSPSEEADQSVTPPEEPSEEDLPPSEILPEED